MPPPPQPGRFPAMGPNAISSYHQQQFQPSHNQHSAGHVPPMSGNPNNYLQQNSQMGVFANSNLMAFSGGLNTPGGAGLGGVGAGGDTGLASHAARMGFAHAGNLQQQQQQQQHPGQQQQGHVMGGEVHPKAKGRIREVWRHNLHEEMATLRELVENYPYIAMDTEFPGIVSRPMGAFRGKSDYHYQCLRTNVDMLKIIQIGLTLFNEKGETPPARPLSTDSTDLHASGGRSNGRQGGPFPYAWQFNFKFSLKDDMYNQTSIESLQQAGIDFAALERDGIDPHEFAALLIPSGLVCFDDVRWISFHGGYDFGYLTKLLICKQLPNDEVEFDRLMKLYFPSTYDVKHLMKHAIKLHNSGMLTPADPNVVEILQKFEHKSGLEHIAETLKVKRVGTAHQAGSDSLLTGRVFFTLRERIFNGDISPEHLGKVWGLGIPDFSLGGFSGASLAAQQLQNRENAAAENTPPNAGGHAGRRDQSQQQTNGGADGPSTPNTVNVGLASSSTPANPAQASQHAQAQLQGTGPMTPGGGGGVFGQFHFGGQR